MANFSDEASASEAWRSASGVPTVQIARFIVQQYSCHAFADIALEHVDAEDIMADAEVCR